MTGNVKILTKHKAREENYTKNGYPSNCFDPKKMVAECNFLCGEQRVQNSDKQFNSGVQIITTHSKTRRKPS